MQLLRDNQDTLLTILEVLLFDPLYSWTITSKQQDVLTIRKCTPPFHLLSGPFSRIRNNSCKADSMPYLLCGEFHVLICFLLLIYHL